MLLLPVVNGRRNHSQAPSFNLLQSKTGGLPLEKNIFVFTKRVGGFFYPQTQHVCVEIEAQWRVNLGGLLCFVYFVLSWVLLLVSLRRTSAVAGLDLHPRWPATCRVRRDKFHTMWRLMIDLLRVQLWNVTLTLFSNIVKCRCSFKQYAIELGNACAVRTASFFAVFVLFVFLSSSLSSVALVSLLCFDFVR